MNYRDLQNISYLSQNILTESAYEEHDVMNRWPYSSPYLQEERAPGVKPYKAGPTGADVRKDAAKAEKKRRESGKDKPGYGTDDKKFAHWTARATPASTLKRKKKEGGTEEETVSQRMDREHPYKTRMTGPMAREYGSRHAAEVTRVVKGAGEPQAVTYPRKKEEAKTPRVIKQHGKWVKVKEDFALWMDSLLDEGYDLSDYTYDEMYELYLDESQQLNEISDKKVQRLVDIRNRQSDRQDGGAGSPGGAFHAAQRVNRAAARRNQRTGSNVKVDPNLSKPARPSLFNGNQNEEFDAYDLVLAHLIDEGYAESQESANAIMANMSEDWVDSILDNYFEN